MESSPTQEKETRRSLIISTAAGMFGMVWFSIAFGIPTTMLFESLTGSGIMIGLFTTLAQLSAIFQVPSAILSGYFPSRKKYWSIVSVTNRILWFSPVVIILCMWNRPNLAALVLIFVLALAACFGNSATPIWLDWLADIIPEKISEKYWGIRQSLTTVMFFAATALSGWLLDYFPSPDKPGGSYNGFLLVFLIGAVAGILDVVLHIRVPEAKKISVPAEGAILEKIVFPMKDANFRNMTFAYASWFLAMGIIGPFGFVYLKRIFNADYTELSVIAASASLSAAIFGMPNGIIINKIGARTYFCIGLFIAPLFWLVWFLAGDGIINLDIFSMSFQISESVLAVSVALFMAGIFGSGVGICQLHLGNVVAEKKWRRIGIAEHWAIIGLVSAAGPFIGGAITDYFTRFPLDIPLPSGKNMSYIHIQVILALLITWFLAIPFMLKVKMTKEEIGIKKIISAIYLYPMRGFGSAYNIIGSKIIHSMKNSRH
ncbi:MAG TPA: hypothetical protein PK821_02625 [Victivallales bacterium]|nr:hypothetical protein [Victivallales bacterium]